MLQHFIDIPLTGLPLAHGEEIIHEFEQETNLKLPEDYRTFLVELEAYIEYTHPQFEGNENSSHEELIDDLFCDYYFNIPGYEEDFEIVDFANISLGYFTLEVMMEDFSVPGSVMIAHVFCGGSFYLSLKLEGENAGQVSLLRNTLRRNGG